MKRYGSKLIVLRGNSASGKSTVAKRLRELSSRKIALVEQDHIRRVILKEKDISGGDNIELIREIVEFALGREYDVVLEGILDTRRYGSMMAGLARACPDHYFYYFDVTLEETLLRHATKPVADSYGEKEMREWFNDRDVTRFAGERIVPESSSLEETAQRVAEEAGMLGAKPRA